MRAFPATRQISIVAGDCRTSMTWPRMPVCLLRSALRVRRQSPDADGTPALWADLVAQSGIPGRGRRGCLSGAAHLLHPALVRRRDAGRPLVWTLQLRCACAVRTATTSPRPRRRGAGHRVGRLLWPGPAYATHNLRSPRAAVPAAVGVAVSPSAQCLSSVRNARGWGRVLPSHRGWRAGRVAPDSDMACRRRGATGCGRAVG